MFSPYTSTVRTGRTFAMSVSALSVWVFALTACSNPDDNSASGASGTNASAEQTLVLLDNNETGGYNPVAGYSRSGDSPVYEGLFRLKAPASAGKDASKILVEFEPLLAAGPAVSSNGNKV